MADLESQLEQAMAEKHKLTEKARQELERSMRENSNAVNSASGTWMEWSEVE